MVPRLYAPYIFFKELFYIRRSKMSNMKISKKYIVDVYSFMEMCGLKCNRKKNIRISNRIMLRKLSLRHDLFPNEVVMPIMHHLVL